MFEALTSLTLVSTIQDPLPLRIPFRLQKVVCMMFDHRHALRLIDASRESLTDLKLYCSHATTSFLNHSTLPSHLMRLSLPRVEFTILEPSFRHFTPLSWLHLYDIYEDDPTHPLDRIVEVLSASPSTLRTLILNCDRQPSPFISLSIPRCLELPALAKLESLAFVARDHGPAEPGMPELHEDLPDGYAELLDKCARREISVTCSIA